MWTCCHFFHLVPLSTVVTPICSIVNLVAVRSVLFFDTEVIIWVYRCFWAWLPERQLWGTLVMCINARWPLWTPGSPPDGISFNCMIVDTCLSYNFYPGNSFVGSIWWLWVNLWVKCQVQGHFRSRNVVQGSCTCVLDLENKFSTTKTSQHEPWQDYAH